MQRWELRVVGTADEELARALALEWRASECFHGQMAAGDLERMSLVAVEFILDRLENGPPRRDVD